MGETASHDIVAAAAALAPQIRSVRDELEQERKLPTSLVEALNGAGLLQLNLPRSIGGPETDPLISFRAIEQLSQADGSVGWCAFVSGGACAFLGWLRPEVGRAMLGNPPDLRMSGSIRPEGEARIVDGGYRVSGRWDFASGIDHANWLLCTCKIVDDHGPRLRPDGTQLTRSMLVPRENATVHDTWVVVGLRGTGSHDFTVDDVFVPLERSFSVDEEPQEKGPLFHRRLVLVNIWATNAGNALGMARGAMDAFLEMAVSTGSTGSTVLLRDRPQVQATVGEAEAIISAARAYVLDAIGRAWAVVCEGVADPGPEIAQARLAITHSIRESVRAVDLLFNAAGTNAIRREHSLERFFRDLHVAVQHGAGLLSNIESAGQSLLGLQPSGTGW